MILKTKNIFLIGFVASLLVLIESSSGTPIQNELLEELKAELKSLRVKVDLLEARNIENVNLLTTQVSKHDTKISKQEVEITKLKAKIDAKQEAGHPSAAFDDERDLNPNNENKMSSAINKKERPSGASATRALAPSSCRELSVAGHYSNGLYLIQNLDTKKIETVLCTFGTSVSQDLIGQIDLKTQTVHFYVQRESIFRDRAVIPFELARLNEGDAFDLISGIFTVPVPGIYHFDFSGIKDVSVNYLAISIQVNGVHVGRANTSKPATGTGDAVSLSASLRLAAGDRVNLYNNGDGVLYDDTLHYTHFNGWLVEEDLM